MARSGSLLSRLLFYHGADDEREKPGAVYGVRVNRKSGVCLT